MRDVLKVQGVKVKNIFAIESGIDRKKPIIKKIEKKRGRKTKGWKKTAPKGASEKEKQEIIWYNTLRGMGESHEQAEKGAVEKAKDIL